MPYQKLKEAVRRTGLHPHTLRKYGDDGTIPTKRTPSGQRMFDIDAFLKAEVEVATVLYARVSSAKQKDDLERQIAFLRSKWGDAELVTDVASGLNFKRKGLRAVLERCLCGAKLRVVVAHKDRLARFGYELVEWLITRTGGEIVVLHKSISASPLEELMQDLLAVLSVFAARMHGLRKYRDEIKADKNLSVGDAENDIS